MEYNDDIMVTVWCTVYNHEKYLKQCLEGFVNQVTSFKFEVLVHDDASTDQSVEIILQYAERFPDIIKPILQVENKYSKNISIPATYLLPKTHGKYVAICEGDDFWTDQNKLQRQVDALEANPNCGFSVHKVRCIKENGFETDLIIPEEDIKEGIIESKDFLMKNIEKEVFHTTSYFFRAYLIKKYWSEDLRFRKVSPVGDKCYMLYFGSITNCYYVNMIGSCYRMASENSWTSRNLRSALGKTKYLNKMIKMFDEFNQFTNHKYNNAIDCRIKHLEFEMAIINKDYSKIILPCYRKWFVKYNWKFRIAAYGCAYFPWLKIVFQNM